MHWIDEVLAIALQYIPVAVSKKSDEVLTKLEAESTKVLQSGQLAH